MPSELETIDFDASAPLRVYDREDESTSEAITEMVEPLFSTYDCAEAIDEKTGPSLISVIVTVSNICLNPTQYIEHY